MPAKRKTFKRKKVGAARRPNVRGIANITRSVLSIQAVPDRMNVKLAYSDIQQMTSTATANTFIVRGNSCFDPDFTGAGHQPRAYDQWAAFYNSYVVLSSTLELVPVCLTASVIVALYPKTDTTADVSVKTVLERPRMKYRTLQAGGNPSTRFTSTSSSMAILGIDKTEIFDDQYSAGTTGNPTQQWFWSVTTQHPDVASTALVSLVWKITYNVMFFNRKVLAQS